MRKICIPERKKMGRVRAPLIWHHDKSIKRKVVIIKGRLDKKDFMKSFQ